jgi:hypothetical protein
MDINDSPEENAYIIEIRELRNQCVDTEITDL